MCHKRNNRACDGNDRWDGYSGLAGSERVMVNLRHHLNEDTRDYMKAATEKSERKGNQAKPRSETVLGVFKPRQRLMWLKGSSSSACVWNKARDAYRPGLWQALSTMSLSVNF